MSKHPKYPQPVEGPDALPKNYDAREAEARWQAYWEECGVYKFEPARLDGTLRTREEIFSIDTPPPTVSGALHIGHVYSYTQTDMNARYQRMRGKQVFYPFGFDDNGLPTERLVEKVTGKRANDVIAEGGREAFIELCKPIVENAEQEFIALWKSLALSCDWSQFYTTIDERSRAISQSSFIDLYNKGYIYRKVAPTQWDWVNQTAIAQAEIEDREVPGQFHDIRFGWADGPGGPVQGHLTIATTRPELIPACVAVFAHPDDERYKHLFGKMAITPLFEVEVPILPSEKANPEKGTGILMCCTFGDMDDVEHWKEFNLPTRVLIGKDGRIDDFDHQFYEAHDFPRSVHEAPLSGTAQLEVTLQWPCRNIEKASAHAATLAGLKVKQARERIKELLQESGELLAMKDIVHTVRHAERGDVPVEILVTPQWYVNILDHKDELIEQGRKVNWQPEYMRKRYEQWVEGLNADWCISRQRYNGVPFPVWYGERGECLLAGLDQLPVNPLADARDGCTPDPDVMDTWATSSTTPFLNTHLLLQRDEAGQLATSERHSQLFPFDMRPQAHDIIRTWAFYTIAKAYFHCGEIPWKDIVISGHAQDAGGKKISKSKGHVVTPAEMVEKYSADGLRYWSGSVRLGTDTLYDERNLTEGRKLINKLFNATKFALRHLIDFDPFAVQKGRAPAPALVDAGIGGPAQGPAPSSDLLQWVCYPTDLWLLSRLNETIERATRANDAFEFGEAKQAAEDFFWADLCDNYLELSKGRLYGEPLAVEAHDDYTPEQLRRSAQATLHIALSAVLRLFAPVLPHITEECWSWHFARFSDKRSIHEEEWPTPVGTAFMPSAVFPESIGSDSRAYARRSSTEPVGSVADTINGVPTADAATLLLHTVAAVRKWKSEQSVSVKKPLAMLHIYRTELAPRDADGAHLLAGSHLHAVLGDLMSTCNAREVYMVEGDPPTDAVTTERSWVAVVCGLAADEQA